MTNFSFENYPVDGDEGVLRQVPFGLGSKSAILVELDPTDEEGVFDIAVTVGNGPDNDEALEGTASMLEYVCGILRSGEVAANYQRIIDGS